jgi:hypothetical protein
MSKVYVGDKNIFKLPEDVHKYLHKGSGGGWWNDMWMGLLKDMPSGKKVDPNEMIEQFKAMRQVALAALGITP